MVMTDPLADMLTRIRNGYRAGHQEVVVPSSKLKNEVCRILRDRGFIDAYKFEQDATQGIIRIHLRYDRNNKPVLTGIERVSRPGLRRYAGSGEAPQVLGGLGLTIISTSRGVMTDDDARQANVGGELLCRVW